MNRAKNRSRARFGGLLALALGVAALLAIPVVSAARNGGADDGARHGHDHGEKRHHHHRHHGDRQISGTITAFDADSGELTIETRSGNSVSGLVDGRTKIKCEDQERSTGHARHARSGEAEPGDDNGGDNSGPGSGNSGPSGHDDNGAGANCTTAALVSGAVVQEADLEPEHGSARFDEVELAH